MKYFTTEKFIWVLSAKSRQSIMNYLTKGEKCVSDMADNLKLPENLISNHLAILRQAQVVNTRKEGLRVYYSLNKKVLEYYMDELKKTVSQ